MMGDGRGRRRPDPSRRSGGALARARLVAMTRRADGSFAVQPSWVPLILEDASAGSTVIPSTVKALRQQQLDESEYDRNRAARDSRERKARRGLERALCGRAVSKAKAPERGSGAPADDGSGDSGGDDADSESDHTPSAGRGKRSRKSTAQRKALRAGKTAKEGHKTAAVLRHERDAALTAAGQWTPADLTAVVGKSQATCAGLCVGPMSSGQLGCLSACASWTWVIARGCAPEHRLELEGATGRSQQVESRLLRRCCEGQSPFCARPPVPSFLVFFFFSRLARACSGPAGGAM